MTIPGDRRLFYMPRYRRTDRVNELLREEIALHRTLGREGRKHRLDEGSPGRGGQPTPESTPRRGREWCSSSRN